MSARIRDFTAADEKAVVALSLRAWTPVFEAVAEVLGTEIDQRLHGEDWRRYQEAEVRATLDRDGVHTWVAEAGDGVIGFVSASVVDAERLIGALDLLAVDPASQRRGVGTALTEVATDWLRDEGMRVAFIATGGDDGHAPARRLYEKAAYTLLPAAQYFKAL